LAGSSDRGRSSSLWAYVAGAILALQGLATILYSGFIPPPITDAGIDVPLLGRLSFVWVIVGGVAIVAAYGVLRRRAWGRSLGTASEILVIVGGLMTATSVPMAALALVIPGVVLFALWRGRSAPAST